MTDAELWKALIGLYAWDTGDRVYGVYDPELRQRCLRELRGRETGGGRVVRLFGGRLLRERFLSEEALADGYGPEDMINFVMWMAERMGWQFAGWTELRGL